jgi:redox-sensitive bicupin YhaK (pirin superfamily)
MPGSSTGRLQGFQLWVNLPSEQKMCPPRYQEVASGLVPTVRVPGASVRVISGSFGGARGAVDGISIDPLFIDARVDPSGTVEVPVVADHTAFVHVYEGDVEIGVTGVTRGALAVLVAGDSVSIRAGGSGARLLLVAGRPIGEPIVRWGPFVMNTEDEIRQAIEDYRMGIL